jgi:lysophospholipase L1-like esterase
MTLWQSTKWTLFCLAGLCLAPLQAQNLTLKATRLQVQTQAGVPDLQCTAPKPPVRPSRQADSDPVEVPDEDQVSDQVQAFLKSSSSAPWAPKPGRSWLASEVIPSMNGQVLRVGIWGDSHMAAAFWTQELLRLSQLRPEQMHSRFVPANMNRPGVRLPLRKSCLGPDWRHEPAHVAKLDGAPSGPGLVQLASLQNGAWLAWDIRHPSGLADKKWLRLQYIQTAQPLTLRVRVDGAAEYQVSLKEPAGPAALDLWSDAPISTVEVTVLEGPWRLQGLEWPVPESARVQMDVFAYPGATVAGWRQVDPEKLRLWWHEPPYDWVVLAFGTNEGNATVFDAQAYTKMLQQAVASWRQVFPHTACLLVAPGDRGVLVQRSQKAAQKSQSLPLDLLRYTRVHDEIGRIQKQVAQAHGCHAWSMLEAMGGAGSAYRWARHNPPLMARDLIHFTVPGYQRLAQRMAQDLGWGPALFQDARAPAANR